jgi:hypothetical protein
MSVRSRWQPPNFNISASGPSETTTVVVMPQPETTNSTQTVVYSTVISTISTPSVYTVTILPTPSPPVVTATVSVPAIGTTTAVVVPQASTVITTTIVSVPQVPLSTVTLYPQAPHISTVIVAPLPPQITTVTVISQRPQFQTNTVSIRKSTITVQKPASTVTYHYQDPASTIVIQPPTVTASRSPSVIEIPMTMISTATHTVVRSVRAVQTPASTSPRDSAMAKLTCETCDGNLECDVSQHICSQCAHGTFD